MRTADTRQERCVVIGAGPAGLTAAFELSRLGLPAIVLEADAAVGGLSRTVRYGDYRFDIGGHRFFTKVEEIQEIWEEILGEDLLSRPRMSRIFYEGRFFEYPLRPLNALRGLGAFETLRVLASFLRAQILPHPEERSFEQWVTNRFGRRLFEIFFKSYTEKVWGMSCSRIDAEWAAQRIRNLDLATAIRSALLGRSGGGEVVKTLIDRFHYPRLGPGMMWERLRDLLVAGGVPTLTGAEVVAVHHRDDRIEAVTVRREGGGEERVLGAHFLSSMPIRDLVHALRPAPPATLLAAADRLHYRDFLTVALVVDAPDLFPDNWIYVHSPSVRVGRIQNFKNWSPDMVPDAGRTTLGLEYFVQEGDDLWTATDAELLDLGRRECAALGLVDPSRVVDGAVVRVRKAYPVYDDGYRDALHEIRAHLGKFANLQLIGRNGQHRYNNQDHSMVTGLAAARNLAGESHDVWSVNVEGEYQEEIRDTGETGRRAPRSVSGELDARVVRAAFARYDPVALGGAVAAVLGSALFAATGWLLLRNGEAGGPTLSLLGSYLIGYRVTWLGAWVGLLEATGLGFAFGYALARGINRVVGWHEAAFRRRIELLRALDPLERE
jgi:protoporphyrinogen oxidase